MRQETPEGALSDPRRGQLMRDFAAAYEQSLDERVDRYLEVAHQTIIPNHYFAEASTQCIDLYRDGYFLSAVMVSQAVNEGIFKMIEERNGISASGHEDLLSQLRSMNLISESCAEASRRIWKSFRNDTHHMNPKVASIPFREVARNNLKDLALIEKEIFDVSVGPGGLMPKQPMYWDIKSDGTVDVFLRLL